jgi:hypothetical protein
MARNRCRGSGSPPGPYTTYSAVLGDFSVLLGDAERKQRRAVASEFSAGPGREPDAYCGRTPPCEPKTKLAKGHRSLPRPYLTD